MTRDPNPSLAPFESLPIGLANNTITYRSWPGTKWIGHNVLWQADNQKETQIQDSIHKSTDLWAWEKI